MEDEELPKTSLPPVIQPPPPPAPSSNKREKSLKNHKQGPTKLLPAKDDQTKPPPFVSARVPVQIKTPPKKKTKERVKD